SRADDDGHEGSRDDRFGDADGRVAANARTGRIVKRLHIISYLAPSIPAEFFRLIARDLDATLEFNETISGPLQGDDEPFTSGRADVGFVCAPTYRWLRPKVELLPLPVPGDPRADGRPIYFGDVIARPGVRSLEELRGGV